MKPLNYLRQAKAFYAAAFAGERRSNFPQAGAVDRFLEAADAAEKFILPKGGRIFDDELRGLDGAVRLPFARCLIEYEAVGEGIGRTSPLETERCSRRIVYAEQVGNEHLVLQTMLFADSLNAWVRYPLAAMFKASALDSDGAVEFFDVSGCGLGRQVPKEAAVLDLADEARAVFEMIEALSCSNVELMPMPMAKLNKSAARRGALPFDEYKTLVVRPTSATGNSLDSDRRSPREHLRRGHIRRLPNGRKTWIQACVVAAGAAGKINKNYDLRRVA